METCGNKMIEYRLSQGFSLKRYCIEHKIDLVLQSKAERGLIDPIEYARHLMFALNLTIEQATELYELATQWELPPPLTEKEFVGNLPLFTNDI